MSALASKTDNSIILKINSVLEKSSAELKEVVESELKKEVESLKQAVANAQNKLSNSSKFIYEALGEAPETKIFTTDVTRNTYSAEFLIGFGCEDFSELTKTKKSDESLLRELEALL
jgi:thiamine pyrophosphate-dependent acetolactate synthase large subunit-like protein